LERWVGALAGVCRGLTPGADAVEAAALAVKLLATANEGWPVSTVEFERALFRWKYSGELGSALYRELKAPWNRAEVLLEMLEAFGATKASAGGVGLSALGVAGLDVLKARVPAALTSGSTAAEVLARVSGLGDDDAWYEARHWLHTRPVGVATGELLHTAADLGALARRAAMDLVERLGEEAAPALNAVAEHPSVGPWARAGIGTTLTEADLLWHQVEEAVLLLETRGAQDAYTYVWQHIIGGDLAERLTTIEGSSHPQAALLNEELRAVEAAGLGRPEAAVYEVKVSLSRWRPAVWRRAQVPADGTLADLHHVVQALMNWDGDHLHAFTVGRTMYADYFHRLEGSHDEHRLRIDAAFDVAPGKKIDYIYDLGSEWRHDIKLERVIDQPEFGVHYPRCTGGAGEAPVEDWNEDSAEEGIPASVPYDEEAINSRLQELP
jgi:hypothetical protein